MPKPQRHTFILNDESKVNVYGFRVPNKALSLERFEANPVMLADHTNGLPTVIGRWENLRVEGAQLLADAEFDTVDEAANQIAGKVERGFIKGCSIGFMALGFRKAEDGVPEVTRGELLEASICAIPANASALKLYAPTGDVMTAADIKLSLSTVSDPKISDLPKPTMKNITLSLVALAALGFTEVLKDGDEGRLSLAIEKLAADLKAAQTENEALKAQMQTLSGSQGKALVSAAITAGKITEAERARYEKLAVADYELAAETLTNLPGKTTLGLNVKTPTGTTTGEEGLPQTADEFQKLSKAEKLAFKADHPEAYHKLFA